MKPPPMPITAPRKPITTPRPISGKHADGELRALEGHPPRQPRGPVRRTFGPYQALAVARLPQGAEESEIIRLPIVSISVT